MIFFVYVYDILGYVMFVVPAAPNGLAFPLRSVAFATWPMHQKSGSCQSLQADQPRVSVTRRS